MSKSKTKATSTQLLDSAMSAILTFQEACELNEYTDTGEAQELLAYLVDTLGYIKREHGAEWKKLVDNTAALNSDDDQGADWLQGKAILGE